jgi:hypothetical protein
LGELNTDGIRPEYSSWPRRAYQRFRTLLEAEALVRPWWRPPAMIAVPMIACAIGAAVCFTLLAMLA